MSCSAASAHSSVSALRHSGPRSIPRIIRRRGTYATQVSSGTDGLTELAHWIATGEEFPASFDASHREKHRLTHGNRDPQSQLGVRKWAATIQRIPQDQSAARCPGTGGAQLRLVFGPPYGQNRVASKALHLAAVVMHQRDELAEAAIEDLTQALGALGPVFGQTLSERGEPGEIHVERHAGTMERGRPMRTACPGEQKAD